MYYKLCELNEINNGEIKKFDLNNMSILLIKVDSHFFIIENKCGHFGVPLEKGNIVGEAIICREHYIKFDLNTGKNINRPYEPCDDVKTYKVIQTENEIGLELN